MSKLQKSKAPARRQTTPAQTGQSSKGSPAIADILPEDSPPAAATGSDRAEFQAGLEALAGGGGGSTESVAVAGAGPVEIPGAVYGPFWESIFGIIGRIAGDHWLLQAGESESLSTATERVVNRYLPTIAGRAPELIALVGVLAVVVMPRLMIAPTAPASEKSPAGPETPQGYVT